MTALAWIIFGGLLLVVLLGIIFDDVDTSDDDA